MLTEIILLRFQRTQSQCAIVVIFGLKRADCMDQRLVAIPRSLPVDINVFTFTGNLLSKLDMDDFRQYHSLQEIYLVRNLINNVAPDAFRGLHNLQILDLQGNKLTGVPIGAFQHLSSVRILVLKSNPIRYLTPDCFRALSNIEVLNFENCWLERVHPHAFRGLDKLNEVNLVNNELRGLSADMVDFLPPSLTIIRLHRNPWNCDCRLRWLRRWLSLSSINWDFASNSPTCSEPKLLSDISWRHLGWERFACPSVIVNTVTSVRVQLGTNISVDCIVLGDPEPVIIWTRNAKPVPKSFIAINYESNEVGDKQVRSSVVIKNATKRDMGDYKCMADNSAGRSEVTYKVWTEEEEVLSLFGNFTAGRLRREEIVLLGVSVGSLVLVASVVFAIVFVIRRNQARHQTYRIHDLKSARKDNGSNLKSDTEDNSTRSSRENTLLSETGSTGLLESIGEDCDTGLMPLHYRSPSAAKKLHEPTLDDPPSSADVTSRCLQKFFSRLKDRKTKDSPPSSPIDVWFIKTEGGGQCEFTPDILRCEMTLQSLQAESDCLPTIPEDDDVDDDVTCDVSDLNNGSVSDYINGSVINDEDADGGGCSVALTSFGARRLNSRNTEGADESRTKLGLLMSFDVPHENARDSYGKASPSTASFDEDMPNDYQSTQNRICDETNPDPLTSFPLSDPRSLPKPDSTLFKDTLTAETGHQTTPLNSNRSQSTVARATIADEGPHYRSEKWNSGTHIRASASAEAARSAGDPDGSATGFRGKSWDNVRRVIRMAPSDKDVQRPDSEAAQHVRDINNDCNCDYESGFSSRPEAHEGAEEDEEGEDGVRPKPGQRDAFGTTV